MQENEKDINAQIEDILSSLEDIPSLKEDAPIEVVETSDMKEEVIAPSEDAPIEVKEEVIAPQDDAPIEAKEEVIIPHEDAPIETKEEEVIAPIEKKKEVKAKFSRSMLSKEDLLLIREKARLYRWARRARGSFPPSKVPKNVERAKANAQRLLDNKDQWTKPIAKKKEVKA